jgi:uncharacterized membrane protein
MRHLFWLAAAVLLAVALHAGFVLAVPSFTLKREIARIGREAGANTFFVLGADDRARLFPAYPPGSVIGVCAFDISAGPIDLSAEMEAGYWTLTVYSSTGDVIYALNDAQSGVAHFTVSLKKAPGLWEMLAQTGAEEVSEATGWTVRAGDPRGLAVLWQPVAEPARRPSIVQSFARTTCRPPG